MAGLLLIYLFMHHIIGPGDLEYAFFFFFFFTVQGARFGLPRPFMLQI